MARSIRHFNVTNSTENSLCSVQFSRDDEFIATSDLYGTIRVTNTNTGQLSPFILNGKKDHNIHQPKESDQNQCGPIISFKWRPESDAVQQKKVITAVRTDGFIQQFHAVNGKSLSLFDAYGDIRGKHENTSGVDYMPGLLCMDYNGDGSQFATSGKDPEIFLFDELTKKKVVTFPRNVDSPNELTGHSSRVCTCKYLNNPSRATLVTGAWDNTIQFWDERIGNRNIGMIDGPQVSTPHSIDVHDNMLLVGSFRTQEQVLIYDLRTRTLSQDLTKTMMDMPMPNHHGLNTSTFNDNESILGSEYTLETASLLSYSTGPNNYSNSMHNTSMMSQSQSQAHTNSINNSSAMSGSADDAGGKGGTIHNHIQKKVPKRVFPLIPPKLQVHSAQFSANGKYIAIGGSNTAGDTGFLRVMNTFDLSWEGSGCKCAVFSNRKDNLLCAIGTEGKVTMIDI